MPKGRGFRAENPMSTPDNVQIVKAAFAAISRGDLALFAEDIEWIIPGEWPLAGAHRGHAGLADFFQKASETVETSISEPREFVSQGDRVMVIGFATGRIKATNRTFEDHFVFAITVGNGKVTNIREYIDTLALARASETEPSSLARSAASAQAAWPLRSAALPPTPDPPSR
jgi:ketosteroid isomerase-like protein